MRLAAPMAAAAILAGCASAQNVSSSVAGFGVGAIVGGITANPFIAVAVGVAAEAGAREGAAYLQRRRVRKIHNTIAGVAGPLAVGEREYWAATTDVPPSGYWGQVQVIRDLGSQIPCREVLFTVEDDDPSYFVAIICKGTEGWRWAVSAPSTERWDGLQ